ncbi:MAG: ISLre2 family transposase [Isosphaeraceae bacterium]
MTSAGRVALLRRSLRCTACGLTAYPADERLGLDGFLSPGATRLACLAAASWSFDVAAARLEELAGVRLDDETIRRHVHRAAERLAARREAAPPRAAFEAADGEAEFLTDGVMAPTRAGWRELKMAMYLKRPAGEPAEPEGWADRDLPRPTALAAYASPADCEAFAARWGPRAEALGIDPAGPLTVLGDGAEWIWNAAAVQFPAARQVLDIFHAAQHLAAAGAALHGEGTAAAAEWTDAGRRALLADGWPGLLDHVGATPTGGRTAAGQAGIDALIAYFAKHTDRLGYYGRLRAGRSIGSGAIEGLARRMGRRLKVPGRGWCAGHLSGMAAVIATVDTPEWEVQWSRPAA